MWEGLVGSKVLSSVFSFLGALLSLRFIKADTWVARVLLVVGGFGLAEVGKPVLMHAFQWPPVYGDGTAFLIGMFGMAICDALARAVASADVWGVIRTWLERK